MQHSSSGLKREPVSKDRKIKKIAVGATFSLSPIEANSTQLLFSTFSLTHHGAAQFNTSISGFLHTLDIVILTH